jgi:hypothetical protein
MLRQSHIEWRQTSKRWRVELVIRRRRQAGELGVLLSQVLSVLLVPAMGTVCEQDIWKVELDALTLHYYH